MYKIYAYIRQSSLEQVRYGYNLEEQERQIKDYCEYNYKDNYELSFYIDAGRSGTNMKRPQLQKLLSDSKKNKPDIIVFHNIDRLSRELIDLWSMIKYFNQLGIKLASVIGYIDLSTAYGKGNVLNEGLSAMIESMKISDRTIRALKEGVKQGKYPFPFPPLGYMKKDNKLVISDNQNEIDAINFIFNSIADNKYNLLTIRKMLKINFGISISEDRLRRIIKNKLYIGTMEYHEILIDNYCPALIPFDLWDSANKRRYYKRKSFLKSDYFFKNVCFCVNCNNFMFSTCGKSHTKKNYSYYKCPICNKTVSQVKLVKILEPQLNKLAHKFTNDKKGINDLLNDIKKLKKKKSQLVEEQYSDAIDVPTFYKLYHDLDLKLSALENQISNLEIDYISYNMLSSNNKRHISANYIKRIEITFNNKKYTAKIIEM